MSRYIDADALIDRLDYCVKEGMGSTIAFTFKHMVEDAPSIDIVRCAKCIWRDKDNQGEVYCTYVKGLADINEDSFCSYGERKESE